MATAAQWVQGARPRTLPASVAPVVVGTGAAADLGGVVWSCALLALVVAVAMQVGVNFANDYSDGVRGTDADRVGPARLVGGGAASPRAVRGAALGSLALAAVAGLVLVAVSGTWVLLGAGAVALLAAWGYTGGRRPYGYRGLGEVAVFVFFGLLAVLGTTYVQAGTLSSAAVLGAVGSGAFACAVLVANNLRDIPTDAATGKRTVAVRLGDSRTRRLYAALALAPFVGTLAIAIRHPAVLVALLALALLLRPLRAVRAGASGPDLVPVLKATAAAQLVWAVTLAAALTSA